MSELVFIRHAATDFAGTFCGQIDPPLNAAGELQLAALAQRSELEGIGAVYSSDLHRARATAAAIAKKHSLGVMEEAALREIAFGDWEGLRWEQVEAADAAFARRWSDAFPQIPAPGGEPYAAFRTRVLSAVHRLRQQAMQRVAIVTHAGVLRLILQDCGGFDAARAWEITRAYGACFVLLANGKIEVGA